MHGSLTSGEVRAWDLPTRLFKWTLVALVCAAPLTKWYGDVMLLAHKLTGYAILILLVWRVIWGFVGGTTARWSAFLVWPWQAVAYLRKKASGETPAYLSHNPLGGYMVVALMGLTGAIALAGLFATDGIISDGPFAHLVSESLSKRLTGWHHWLGQALLALVLLHGTLNLVLAIGGGSELPAMIHGRKPRAVYADASETAGGSLARAGIVLVVAAAIVLVPLALFGQSPFR